VLMEGSSSHRDLGVEGLSLDLAAIVHGLVGDEMKPWTRSPGFSAGTRYHGFVRPSVSSP
jgi:hypothetical protein